MKLRNKIILITLIFAFKSSFAFQNQINSFSTGGVGNANQNLGYGTNTLDSLNTGDYNNAFGYTALYSTSSGSNNTAIGHQAGYSNSSGSSNIFLGYQAGYNETGSDKLYISNSNTASPLIYGDFSAGEIKINGNLKTSTLQDVNGVNMIRKVGDVVHIGANSVTIEDSTTTTSGKDEIGSTINDLQIGTSSSHNTTVIGGLIIQDPTAGNHAATRSYVDGLSSMAAVLDTRMPTPGKNNRVSLSTAIVNNESAVGLSMVGLFSDNNQRNWDYSLGIATSNSTTISKGGFGFSW